MLNGLLHKHAANIETLRIPDSLFTVETHGHCTFVYVMTKQPGMIEFGRKGAAVASERSDYH